MTNHLSTRVFAPALTPFNRDLSVNMPEYIRFCKKIIGCGAGLAVFGTNSEANSLSLDEKTRLLEGLVEAGIDASLLLPGTGLCALPEAVQLTRRAVQLGCAGALMLPPFYFKPASEEGLFDYYARIIEGVGSDRLQLYLYHIPQFTGVPITLTLIEKLIKHFPRTVVGIKDSSGDWDNTEKMLREFPGFQVFPASEALLEKALPLGAAGCISATANIQPGRIVATIAAWGSEHFSQLQNEAKQVRALFQSVPMIPALKYVVGAQTGDNNWLQVRPPLVSATHDWGSKLVADIAELDFELDRAVSSI